MTNRSKYTSRGNLKRHTIAHCPLFDWHVYKKMMMKGMPLANSLREIPLIRDQILHDAMLEIGFKGDDMMDDVKSYVSDGPEDVNVSDDEYGSEMDSLFDAAGQDGRTSGDENKENQKATFMNMSQA